MHILFGHTMQKYTISPSTYQVISIFI